MDGWIDVTSNLLSKVSSYSGVILKFISTKKTNQMNYPNQVIICNIIFKNNLS